MVRLAKRVEREQEEKPIFTVQVNAPVFLSVFTVAVLPVFTGE